MKDSFFKKKKEINILELKPVSSSMHTAAWCWSKCIRKSEALPQLKPPVPVDHERMCARVHTSHACVCVKNKVIMNAYIYS